LESLPQELEFDGELYVHGWALEKIHGVTSRSSNRHPMVDEIEYHIFDIIEEGVKQLDRTEMLLKLGLQSYIKHPCVLVPVHLASSYNEVMALFTLYIEQGYEGLILRHPDYYYARSRSTGMMKFKPKKWDEYPIVGYKEEVSIKGIPKRRLGSLQCSTDGEDFGVSGMTDLQKEFLWKNRHLLIGKTCKVGYQALTQRGVPRASTYVEIVGELFPENGNR